MRIKSKSEKIETVNYKRGKITQYCACLFRSCLDSMVMYFLLCNTGTPPPALRDFVFTACCLTCSLEECFIRDVDMGLARTVFGVVVMGARRATAKNKKHNDIVLDSQRKMFYFIGIYQGKRLCFINEM